MHSKTAVKYLLCNYLRWGWAAFLNPCFQLKLCALTEMPSYLNFKLCLQREGLWVIFKLGLYLFFLFSECSSDTLVNLEIKDIWKISSTFRLSVTLQFPENGTDSSLELHQRISVQQGVECFSKIPWILEIYLKTLYAWTSSSMSTHWKGKRMTYN